MYVDPALTTKGTPYCSYDSAKDVGLISQRELSTFTGNLAFKLTDNLELFGDGCTRRAPCCRASSRARRGVASL
jgi:iron complex outermembrane receptor protein